MDYSQIPPDQLVNHCVNSRKGAPWEAFVSRFHPIIAAAVVRVAREEIAYSSDLFDDLIQNIYTALMEDNCAVLRAFSPVSPNSIFAYLKVVAMNSTRDQLKRRRSLKRGSGKHDLPLDVLAQQVPAEIDTAPQFADRAVLLREIDELLNREFSGADGERDRTIFWLYYRQGMTAAEIACIPAFRLTTKGVETKIRRLTIFLRTAAKGWDEKVRSQR